MKALSIRQPWAWAILYAGKRIENREWRAPPRFMVGQTFLIHAAKGVTADEYEDAQYFMREIARTPGSTWPADVRRIPGPKELPLGALVARARLADVVRTVPGGHRFDPDGVRCLSCGQVPVSASPPCSKADPWAIPGCLGLALADVEPLPEPIPFKGALGFFEVPDAILRVEEARP